MALTTTNLNQTLNVNGSIHSTSLYQNGTLINFNSYATNTNLRTNYSTTGNDPNYLLKTGGAMTGQITGVTTINGSTGLFGTLATTNNTNVGVPSLGVAGGTGDKLILYAGTSTVYSYSLGIETNALWYSVPSGVSHKFYNGGTNILTIASGGLTAPVFNLTISASGNNPLVIKSTNTTANNCIQFQNDALKMVLLDLVVQH